MLVASWVLEMVGDVFDRFLVKIGVTQKVAARFPTELSGFGSPC